MTEAWPHKPHTFRALRKTFGAMWVRCDNCCRHAPLSIGGLQEVDYRSKTFSCSRCDSEAYLALIEPIEAAGSRTIAWTQSSGPSATPAHRPAARVTLAGGELPGRKIDGRR